MDEQKWAVFYTPDVKRFRSTLSPEEAELFNECLIRICRDPRPDNIRTFRSRKGLPLIQLVYRDDNFVLLYRWQEVTQPYATRKIEVLKATRTGDV